MEEDEGLVSSWCIQNSRQYHVVSLLFSIHFSGNISWIRKDGEKYNADNPACRYDGDIDGFIDGSEKVTSDKVTTIHNINPTEIDICGSKALAESFCTMSSRFDHKGYEYDKVTHCRLVSRLEKLGPVWKLLTLECIYIRDSILSVVPQAPDTIPIFEGAEKFPKGYRYGAWLLQNIGLEVRKDLPEEDDRESVKEVFDRNRKWLDAT